MLLLGARGRCATAAVRRRRGGATARRCGGLGSGAAGRRWVAGTLPVPAPPEQCAGLTTTTTTQQQLHAEGQATMTAHSEGRRRGHRYFTGLAHARRSGPAEGGRQSHHLRVLRRGSSVCESCWMWGPGWSGARVGRGVGFRCNSHGCSWLLATCVWVFNCWLQFGSWLGRAPRPSGLRHPIETRAPAYIYKSRYPHIPQQQKGRQTFSDERAMMRVGQI